MNHIVRQNFAAAGIIMLASALYAPAAVAQRSVAKSVETTATPSNADKLLARPVTLQLTRVSLKEAVDQIAAQAKVWVQYQETMLEAYPQTITLQLSRIPLGVALERALAGTTLRAIPDGSTQLAIVEGRRKTPAVVEGTIRGIVTGARTNRPIGSARITIDASTRGITTRADGRFSITGVSEGVHTITVKAIGYAKVIRTVTVTEGGTQTVDVSLETSATRLDQVVVTGTIIATELKAVPNAMSVITSKQIEERGITRIDQLFRGDVPGLFALNLGNQSLVDSVHMYSRGASGISVNGNPGQYTNPIKTYIDGVEMVNSSYLSQIDPRSIERIEVIAGPQASTIYGSNALNGVMQIFTKRGTTNRPQVVLTWQSGFAENNFSRALTPSHIANAQVSGAEGRWGYSVGGSWDKPGSWSPSKKTQRMSGYGSARFTAGRFTVDVPVRYSLTKNSQADDQRQMLKEGFVSGAYNPEGMQGFLSELGKKIRRTQRLTTGTIGTTVAVAPVPWWTHEVFVGWDNASQEQMQYDPPYMNPGDTLLMYSLSNDVKTSERYTTTVQLPIASLSRLSVTAGADHSRQTASESYAFPTMSSGLRGALSDAQVRRGYPNKNAGAFLQGQLGIVDAVFLTYGLRAEWNPNYGEDEQPNLAPRYGAAYTRDWGWVTSKLRASYGRSTRPPQRTQNDAIACETEPTCFLYTMPYYGPFNMQLANPNLVPERQQGAEGGIELYFGSRGSLVVTRYNQTVSNIIYGIFGADSVQSLVEDPFGYCSFLPTFCGYNYYKQTQFANIASLRNQGWELQGSVALGPLTTTGTYSWTKSRSLGVTPQYRARFSPDLVGPYYQRGASFPTTEHTWALGFSYAHAASTVALNLTGTGQMYVADGCSALCLETYPDIRRFGRVQGPRANFVDLGGFRPGYAMADLNAAHRFSGRLEATLQVHNVANYYQNDADPQYPVIGRQSTLGLRVRF